MWGRCTVHLTRSDLPDMRKKAPLKPTNFKKFMFRFKQAMKFPGSEWFRVAWKSLARNFRNRGEGRFIDLVEKNVMDPDKSGACMMGWAALKCTTHINSLEIGNKWAKREISEWLHEKEPNAALPTSLTLLVQAMVDLWPKWR